MPNFWAKYNTQTTFEFPLIKRGVVDFAQNADYTPAAGDAAISKDNGNFVDTTNTIAIGTGTPTRGVSVWKVTLTATELSCAVGTVQIVDAATKAIEDQAFVIYTYGNASAFFAGDWSDIVHLGLTSLPNAAAQAAGGLYTIGSGAGQINQLTNGQIDINVARWLNVAPNSLVNGKVDATDNIRSGTAQGGAAGSITLDAGASATDNLYRDLWVLIISGTGAGQVREVSGYVGSTKVASVSKNWITNPDATSVFIILPSAAVENVVNGVTVSTNNDKTGYSIAQAFPTNFASLAITGGGAVTVGTNNDKTGYTLSSAGIQAIYDFATSLLTTVGSIGKLLVTNLDTNVGSRLPTSSYVTPLDAAGTRTAIGLASANLDTQITSLPDNILDKANGVESGWTVRQLFRLWLAGICGPRASFNTSAPTVQNPGATKTRLTGVAIDANGNGTWTTDVT